MSHTDLFILLTHITKVRHFDFKSSLIINIDPGGIELLLHPFKNTNTVRRSLRDQLSRAS